MKTFLLLAFLLLGSAFTAFAQNHEYAPLQEKELAYKNWSYKAIGADDAVKEVNLREFAKGKKLVMVVYFAPWCPNWKLQAPVAQRFYEKYKANGFDVIGVGEYDTVAAIKTNIETLKVTFPVVYELDIKDPKERTDAKQKTVHYEYRKQTGDNRNWGSPWSIFLEPKKLNKKGDVLTEKAFVVNGELIEAEAEAFIREKLGLPKEEKKTASVSQNKEIEACAETGKTAELKKP